MSLVRRLCWSLRSSRPRRASPPRPARPTRSPPRWRVRRWPGRSPRASPTRRSGAGSQPDRVALRARRPRLRGEQERPHQRLRQHERPDAHALRRPAHASARLLGPRPARPRGRPPVHHRPPLRLRALRYDKAPNSTQPPRWDDDCPTPPGRRRRRLHGHRPPLANRRRTATETVLIEDWCQQYPDPHGRLDRLRPGRRALRRRGRRRVLQMRRLRAGRQPANPCGDPPGGAGCDADAADRAGRRAALAGLPPAGGRARLARRLDHPRRTRTRARRCRQPGVGTPTPNRRRIVAYGFRNPFRFTFRPGTSELWVGDVGWNTWEEINRIPDVTRGRNFGWPCYEGTADGRLRRAQPQPAARPSTRRARRRHARLLRLQPRRHDRRRARPARPASSSISGLAFYTADQFPAAYRTRSSSPTTRATASGSCSPAPNGLPDPATRRIFAAGAPRPGRPPAGPGRRALLRRPRRRDGPPDRLPAGNNAPTRASPPTPDHGAAPLTVAFDGTRRRPTPTATPLTYAWDLDGDGAFGDSTAADAVVHLHDAGRLHRPAARHRPGRRCTDTPRSRSPPATPPTVTIATPTAATTWAVGDTVALLRLGARRRGRPAARLGADAGSSTSATARAPTRRTATRTSVQDFAGVASGQLRRARPRLPVAPRARADRDRRRRAQRDRDRRAATRDRDLTLNSAPPGVQLYARRRHARRAVHARRSSQSSTTDDHRAVAADDRQARLRFGAWSDGGARDAHDHAPARDASLHRDVRAATRRRRSAGADADRHERVAGGARPRRGLPDHRGPDGHRDALRLYLDGSSHARAGSRSACTPTRAASRARCSARAAAPAPTAGRAGTRSRSARRQPSPRARATGSALLNPPRATGTLRWRDHAGGARRPGADGPSGR